MTPVVDRWGNTGLAPMKVEIDEEVLRKIAAQTGGEYFRATDNKTLAQVYDRINELEKTKIETDDFTKYNELYARYALAALLVLLVEFLISRLWLRRIP
jgi:Ca-activated chloride channel family protein